MKKEHGILFSLPMIQAHKKGIKEVSRRIPGPRNSRVDGKYLSPKKWEEHKFDFSSAEKVEGPILRVPSIAYNKNYFISPAYNVSDLLFVRENFKIVGWSFEDDEATVHYADGLELTLPLYHDSFDQKAADWLINHVDQLIADGLYIERPGQCEDENVVLDRTEKLQAFRPGIHLPKWGSRIWDEVTSIDAQKIQDITEEDCIREGIEIIHNYSSYSSPKTAFNELWNGMHPGSWKNNDWVWVIGLNILSLNGKPENIVDVKAV